MFIFNTPIFNVRDKKTVMWPGFEPIISWLLTLSILTHSVFRLNYGKYMMLQCLLHTQLLDLHPTFSNPTLARSKRPNNQSATLCLSHFFLLSAAYQGRVVPAAAERAGCKRQERERTWGDDDDDDDDSQLSATIYPNYFVTPQICFLICRSLYSAPYNLIQMMMMTILSFSSSW